MPVINEHGQAIGDPLPDNWTSPPRLQPVFLTGKHVQLEPLAETHLESLWDAMGADISGAGWTYMVNEPFKDATALRAWIKQASIAEDAVSVAIIDRRNGRALGWASFMRIVPEQACVEVGNIRLSPLMQGTVLSTEAMHLMMSHAFDQGYRRYEWKCDAFNEPSRRAALRLGFTFEGVFRNATIYKSRNRDTAWFSVIESEWPALKVAHRAWLDAANFDSAGKQIRKLSAFSEGV